MTAKSTESSSFGVPGQKHQINKNAKQTTELAIIKENWGNDHKSTNITAEASNHPTSIFILQQQSVAGHCYK